MTETAERAASTPRTVRFHPGTWEIMESRRGMTASVHIRDMTEAGLGFIRCWTCFEPVPVEFGDLTGKPLAEWIAEAGKAIKAQHRHGHHPVTIGNAAPEAPAPRAAPGSAVFLEPGGKPRVAAAVPEVPASRNKKGRRLWPRTWGSMYPTSVSLPEAGSPRHWTRRTSG